MISTESKHNIPIKKKFKDLSNKKINSNQNSILSYQNHIIKKESQKLISFKSNKILTINLTPKKLISVSLLSKKKIEMSFIPSLTISK